MAHRTPHVFNIPAGIPFARALSRGVIARAGEDPLTLADALIFVPTRRAARSLRDVFAETLGGAALLPRIFALGDVGEESDPFGGDAGDLASRPPIAPLRRRLLLSLLVQRWSEAKRARIPFTQALAYAGELGSFLDEAITHQADLAKIKTLAPEWLAEHWQQVTQFLDIVAQQWPTMLEAEDAVEAAAYRDAKLQALAAQLGGKLQPPLLRWKYSWMKPLFGYKTATWAQRTLPEAKTRLQRNWDKTMFRLEGNRTSFAGS